MFAWQVSLHGLCWKGRSGRRPWFAEIPLQPSSPLAFIAARRNRATLGTVQDELAALQIAVPARGGARGLYGVVQV